jgi:hypothetical protein
MDPRPVLLAYDDLPPGSDIQRVIDGEQVRITVPPGDVPAAVVRQTAYEALASGASSSSALLLLCFIGFYAGLSINRIAGAVVGWAWAFFAIFCVSLVGLVVWVRYGVMLDAIRAGRRQGTVIAATPRRLVVETLGPFGEGGYDVERDRIHRIGIGRGVLRDMHGRARRVMRLMVMLEGGEPILLLPGRDARELRAIADLLNRALSLTPPGSDNSAGPKLPPADRR